MKKVKLSEANDSLAEYLDALQDGPLIVTDRGKPIAALVPIEQVDMETLCVGTNPAFLDLIERSRKRLATEGGLTSDEVRIELGIPTVPANYHHKSRPRKSKVKS